MSEPSNPPGPLGWPTSLGLKPGEWVEVRSREEILSTLDSSGCLDGMPFMPEMLRYCGHRFRVDSRSVIACDTVLSGRGRTMRETVFLEGVRCEGDAHGGCQALCLVYWREAWLKRVQGPRPAGERTSEGDEPGSTPQGPRAGEDRWGPGAEGLHRLTTRSRLIGATLYRCQATELRSFSTERHRLDPLPLVQVLRSGNETAGTVLSVLLWGFVDKLRRRLRVPPVPRVEGRCSGRTPADRIEGLQPGDWVEIKSQEEIEATLDRGQKNRGLWFDVEMLPFCGRKMRLLQRADRIIEEHTGAMLELPNDCWIIEGAVCSGHVSHGRLFCTRKIHSFWREIWFRRTEPPEATVPADGGAPGETAHS
jgi:hypothetical protein